MTEAASLQPPIISLCLAGNGEAAIVYTSPKGKRHVIAKGPCPDDAEALEWDNELTQRHPYRVLAWVNAYWATTNPERRSDYANRLLTDTKYIDCGWRMMASPKGLAKVLEKGEPTT